jgi:uncharacterized protein YndB with AHSA1/START domain
MSRFVFSIFIAAPPERVFALWIDLDRMPEWVGGISRVTNVSGPVDHAGTTYTVWFGRMASRTEVLDVERPHSIRTRFGNRLLRGISEATFEPHDGGTHLTQRLETQGFLAALLAHIFARGSYKGSFRGELATFARLAEAEVQGDRPAPAVQPGNQP